jgi:hypothetical protein
MRNLPFLALACWCLPLAALAQADGGEAVRGAQSANPGSDTPADVDRKSGLETAPAAGAEAPAATPAAAPAEKPVMAPAAPPAPAKDPDDEVQGKIGVWARVAFSAVSPVPVDDLGNQVRNFPLETRLRLAPEVHFKGFGFLAEADAATGVVVGGPDRELVGERTSERPFQPVELRQLYLQYKWKSGVFRVGQQTSNWGLGLLANSGSKDAEPGDFGMVRYGSLNWRALLAARPFYHLGGMWRAIEPVLAADLVFDDSNARYLEGDRAFQGVFALRFAQDNDNYAGVYVAVRRQRREGVTDGGRATDVVALDFAAKWQFFKKEDRVLNLGFEIVTINGTTTQARNENADVLQVHQWGMAGKLNWKMKRGGFHFDFGYASGDQNPSDDRIESFRMDRDYKVGLILFDEILGHQTARAGVRASDPMLVGVAPEGADLIGTRGAITGAWYLFPRIKLSPTEWFDVWGGPLFAFSTAKLTDPFQTRLQGGISHNALGGTPGSYLGTELDLGVQARWNPHEKVTVTFQIEGGLFLPGDAFVGADNQTIMPPVGLGRAKVAVNL